MVRAVGPGGAPREVVNMRESGSGKAGPRLNLAVPVQAEAHGKLDGRVETGGQPLPGLAEAAQRAWRGGV